MVKSGHADVADLKNMIGDLTKAMVRKVPPPSPFIYIISIIIHTQQSHHR